MIEKVSSEVALLRQSFEYLTVAVKAQNDTANQHYGKLEAKIDGQTSIVHDIRRVVDLMEAENKRNQKQNEERFAVIEADSLDSKKKLQDFHDIILETKPKDMQSRLEKLERFVYKWYFIGVGVTLLWIAVWNSREWLLEKVG